MKKLSQQYVKQFLWDNGKWELLSTYEGNHKPLLISRDGFMAKITFSNFCTNKDVNLFGVRNEFYKQNIEKIIKQKDATVKFIDAQGIRKGGKFRMVVTMEDSKGHVFSKTLEHILSDHGLYCQQCAREDQTKLHRKEWEKEWASRIDKSQYQILAAPEALTSETRIDVEEIETGYKFFANIRSIIKGGGQPFSISSNKKYFLYNLGVFGKNNELNSEPVAIVDEEKGETKVSFRCKCGELFERNIYKWMDGRDLCLKCAQYQSSYERKFENFLYQNNILFQTEYRYNECRDVYPLPFDFYLPEYNCLIEIDGIQHFKPVVFSTKEDGNKRLALCQLHDKIKTEFCQQQKIPLLRISYVSFSSDSWEEEFNHFIESLRNNEPR